MPAVVQEWLNLVVRWVHVLAAIMWIGDSFLFMWLDSRITKPSSERPGDVQGELWMTHSGAFYEVVKRKSLSKDHLPATLYWFKWESYGTWISGFLLLIIVYHLNRGALLLDADKGISPLLGIHVSLLLLAAGYGLYELLWKTPLARSQPAFLAVGVLAVVMLTLALKEVFSPRAVFLQIGAMFGTIMTANVFFRIIPAQKHMLAMTFAGQPVDTSYGVRAKGRSVQNHYLTLPVLFTMLSNHFPSMYGGAHPEAVLALLFIFGVGLKYFMNYRAETNPAILGASVAALGTVFFLTRPVSESETAAVAYKDYPPVSWATVQAVMEARCTSCHAPKPTSAMFAAPPLGINLHTPAEVKKHAERAFVRAVATKTMPLGNMTGMTDEERRFVGAWFAQGADVNAPGPSQLGAVAAAAPDAGAEPLAPPDEARALFKTVCAACHGEHGDASGPTAAALNPKPRNFNDPEWQASVTDDHLSTTILKGGPSVGKSPLMPPHPQLAQKPQVVAELVKLVRGFGAKK